MKNSMLIGNLMPDAMKSRALLSQETEKWIEQPRDRSICLRKVHKKEICER